MSPAPPEAGALFTGDDGRISLGTRSELRDELLLSKVRIQPQTLEISESDFSLLASPERAKTLEVINLDQKIQGRSYWIEDGNTSNEILLIDRRDTIRSNVR
jgi:hypothetical protein